MIVVLKFQDGNEIRVDVLPTATVGDLKAKIISSRVIQNTSPDLIKIVFYGTLLSNDNATLADVGVSENRNMLYVIQQLPSPQPAPRPAPMRTGSQGPVPGAPRVVRGAAQMHGAPGQAPRIVLRRTDQNGQPIPGHRPIVIPNPNRRQPGAPPPYDPAARDPMAFLNNVMAAFNAIHRVPPINAAPRDGARPPRPSAFFQRALGDSEPTVVSNLADSHAAAVWLEAELARLIPVARELQTAEQPSDAFSRAHTELTAFEARLGHIIGGLTCLQQSLHADLARETEPAAQGNPAEPAAQGGPAEPAAPPPRGASA